MLKRFCASLALWSITCLYTQSAGCRCCVTEGAYFLTLLIIAGVTIRTIMVNDHCWLVHTVSLGAMTVAGVMRRPVTEVESGQFQ